MHGEAGKGAEHTCWENSPEPARTAGGREHMGYGGGDAGGAGRRQITVKPARWQGISQGSRKQANSTQENRLQKEEAAGKGFEAGKSGTEQARRGTGWNFSRHQEKNSGVIWNRPW